MPTTISEKACWEIFWAQLIAAKIPALIPSWVTFWPIGKFAVYESYLKSNLQSRWFQAVWFDVILNGGLNFNKNWYLKNNCKIVDNKSLLQYRKCQFFLNQFQIVVNES